ncbi:MAG: hypothetical protein C5B53_08935 [Candidatus Melainabacteria bacterium]|nr:MAG: hypothetical protein C5B53_08935 [Candidatus Melainabacteria bacterium]
MKEPETNPFPGALTQSGSAIKRPVIERLRSQDGMQLGYRFWEGKPGAPVAVYLHGIEGHGQWFEKTAAALNERGITVYAADRRGSGMNPRERGHLSRDRVFLSDIEGLLRRVSAQHPGCAIVLLASCWSAKAGAILARRDYKPVDPAFKTALAGLVLICPALYTKVDISLLTKLRIAWQLLQASDRLLTYWPLPLSPAMYTNEPDYLQFLEKDPLRLKEVTASFLIATLFLSLRAKRAGKFISLPVLIVQSGADQIVDIERVGEWYAGMASENKTMRIFPDAFHSIDFDRTWFKEYTHLLSEWLLARSPITV